MKEVRRLDVFDGENFVGSVLDSTPIGFEYASSWIERGGYQISTIALNSGVNFGAEVGAFFENLLPEGVLRDALSIEKKVSSVFALLQEMAGDNIGSLVILPAGKKPMPDSHEKTTWKEVSERFSGGSANLGSVVGEHRISLSGAQKKAAVDIDEFGSPMWPLGTTPSIYIVKPDIKAIDGVWSSAANEALTMRIAKHCDLDVAEVFYEPVSKSCLVKRFDRTVMNGNVARLIQYDFCQMSGVSSDKKYEQEGGPSLKDCMDLINKHSSQKAVDTKRFFQWVFFNIMTGNNDSHAKNLSFYRLADRGFVLTPHYDLMCTRLYPGLSKQFAFKIGGAVQPGEIGPEQIAEMANELGFKSSYLVKLASDIYEALPGAIKKASEEFMPVFSPAEKILSERLMQKIQSISSSFAQRMNFSMVDDARNLPQVGRDRQVG